MSVCTRFSYKIRTECGVLVLLLRFYLLFILFRESLRVYEDLLYFEYVGMVADLINQLELVLRLLIHLLVRGFQELQCIHFAIQLAGAHKDLPKSALSNLLQLILIELLLVVNLGEDSDELLLLGL